MYYVMETVASVDDNSGEGGLGGISSSISISISIIGLCVVAESVNPNVRRMWRQL